MPALAMRMAVAALLATNGAGAAYPDDGAVLRTINDLRAHPTSYAAALDGAAAGYRGRYFAEADGTAHVSLEGAPAVREAAAALARAHPAPPLLPDPILRAAARDHVEAQGPTSAIGHVGAAGDMPGERVRRHGGDIYVGEVIAYGMQTPADVVRALVVDDGVAGRGHRRLLLSPAYRYAGVWCGPHAGQGTMCVIDLVADPGGRPHVPDR